MDPTNDTIGSIVGFGEDYLAANPRVRSSVARECEIRTLPEICRDSGINRIDLLKVDVEGFEFEVMEGAHEMLDNVDAIIVEVSEVRRGITRNRGLIDMLELLNRHEFSVVRVLPSLHSSDAPWKPIEFNLLARRI